MKNMNIGKVIVFCIILLFIESNMIPNIIGWSENQDDDKIHDEQLLFHPKGYDVLFLDTSTAGVSDTLSRTSTRYNEAYEEGSTIPMFAPSSIQNYVTKLFKLLTGLVENIIDRITLNYSFITYFLLTLGLIFLITILIKIKRRAKKERLDKPCARVGYDYGTSSYNEDRSWGSKRKEELSGVSPLFKTSRIEKDFWGDRILKNSSGETIGKLTEGGLFDSERTQRMLNENDQKVGEITEGGFFDSKDTQIIRNKDGKEMGKIETSFWGDRIIKDNSGEKIGEISKNFWGETVIKKTTDKYDYDSGNENKNNNEGKTECPYCGQEYDSDLYSYYCPYCEEEEED